MNFLYFSLLIFFVFIFWFFWKWKKRAILITHSGDYHLDEVFSTAVLILKLKKDKKFFQIIRTRDQKIFQKWRKLRDDKKREVYIYDVGGFYQPEKNEFDHHQIGGAGRRENGIEFSSAGLVWKKFGDELTGSKELAEKIEKKLVFAIDALDNGQQILEPKYDFFSYDLTNLIKLFSAEKKTDWRIKLAFCKSVRLIKFILKKEIFLAKKKILDEKKVLEIYEKSDDKRVLIFEDGGISLSSITENFPEVLFTISKKDKNVWVIGTVAKEAGSFDRRKYLPKSWAGLNESELDRVSGVEGGIFCHRNLFIASTKSLEAAKKMVEIALEA